MSPRRPGVVATTTGDVRGRHDDGVATFRGIPFASAERFGVPRPVAPWTGTRDAIAFGPQAPQRPGIMERALGAGDLAIAEDCLNLNVWTPGCDDARRPVLVWIHGGGFLTGTGASPWYDGSAFARSGVVVVTCNYRLGAFGFTHLAGLTAATHGDRFAASGNLGLLDQVAALDWVRDNIAGFGGNPDDVTIFGESAGGASVLALMAMPGAAGRFQRAIAQSASFTQLRSRRRAEEAASELLAALDLSPADAHRLLDVPLDRVLDAQERVARPGPAAFTAYAPTPDGVILPQPVVDALDTGASAGVPLVIGTTRDEMNLFTFLDESYGSMDDGGLIERARVVFGDQARAVVETYQAARPDLTPGGVASAIATDHAFRIPAVRLAEAHATRRRPTWMYLFAWTTPVFGGRLGSCHGLELPFVFHALDAAGAALFTGDGPERAGVADAMHGAWTAFATGGDPGWAGYDAATRSTMRFAAPSEVVDDPDGDVRAAWNGMGHPAH